MAKQTSGAQGLKGVLIVVMILVIIAFAGTFYLGLQTLRSYSTEVNHRLLDADASGEQIKELQLLKNQLAQSQALVDKANSLFATQDSYQSQALTDIQTHANRAGLTIASTQFDANDNGLGTRIVTVKIAEPVSYSKFVTFLEGIESNLPKMQVSSVTLSHIAGGGNDAVAASDIKISISVR